MKDKLARAKSKELCVLLVEDNEHMRILLSTALRTMRIRRIIECEDGAEAMEKFTANLPDFIVTDLSMAKMDGNQFTRAIRALPDDAQCVVPIIMVTGHTEHKHVAAARDSGVNELLAKPITMAALFHRVEQIVERPRPFVRSPNYTGPCRRRHNDQNYTGPLRRSTDDTTRPRVLVDDTQRAQNQAAAQEASRAEAQALAPEQTPAATAG